jgi:hypothetical protein
VKSGREEYFSYSVAYHLPIFKRQSTVLKDAIWSPSFSLSPPLSRPP